jgi:ATP-dependent RNA helicase DOB1
LDKLHEVRRRFETEGGMPLLDPVKDMSITDETFKSLLEKTSDLKKRIESSAFHTLDDKDARLHSYGVRVRLLEESRTLRLKCKESQNISMREDLRRMKRVLRRQGYISTEGVLGTKGRFSCELSTGDELVLTDMVFDGVFNDLSVEQTVALLSCFVHKEGSKDDSDKVKVRADMEGPYQKLQAAARAIARVSIDAKMNMSEEEYVKSFNPGLVDATYAWAAGSKFVDICKLTDIFEGSIIRSIRRLEELLRQLSSASLAIGNKELQVLFEDGAKKIRRGVVFAASLYLE